MPTRVIIASARGSLASELAAANGSLEVVAHARSLADAEAALGALRPGVLVIDPELAHRDGYCAIPSLRSASPGTAIVLPPSGEPGPSVLRAIQLATRRFERRRDDDGLTLRERDVVRLLALGHTNAEVAHRLSLSVRTVETHRARIRRRLGLSRRTELVRWALERDLLDG